MSLSATLFGRNSFIHKATNVLGLGIPGWLDKKFGAEAAQGARLGEMSTQTSKEGVARPIVWGIVRPIAGNLIACSDPKIVELEGESAGGGKGGDDDEVVMEEHVFRTYAIRICEGPITGIRRVWRNSQLVFDDRGNAWGKTNNPVFLAKAKFYLGGWDQMPSPALQAAFGVANVTAHRGTCYVVFDTEDLTDLGGAVPQFIFEVERSEGFPLTSRPYPIEDVAAVQSSGVSVVVPWQGVVEAVQVSGMGIDNGALREQPRYSSPIEATETPGMLIESGILRTGLKTFSTPIEATETPGMLIESGILRVTLVSYLNYAPEATQAEGMTVTGGSLA